MKQNFKGWSAVAERLMRYQNDGHGRFNEGQRASLRAMAKLITQNSLVLADEVGMGKTRIAVALTRGVVEAGGRVAILVPPGLGFQWTDELNRGQVENAPQVLRSLKSYLSAWSPEQMPDPWFDKPVVLLSHAFSNWRLSERSESWRWALLPALYAMWRKKNSDRLPRGFHGDARLSEHWVQSVAESICKNIPDLPGHCAYERMQQLHEATPWPGALEPGVYSRDEQLRPLLERAVGLGLGAFDLVIIDEAHKSRGSESGLSRLLDSIVLEGPQARRLAMTATPVELDVKQWKQTLARAGVDEQRLSDIGDSVEKYSEAVRRVRQTWRSSEDSRAAYGKAASRFQASLSPFLLRRDKRQDDAVRKFMHYTDAGADAYRCEKEISIETVRLSSEWRRAICAAEAFSLVTRDADDPQSKRLRLTLGSGHGIAAVIAQIHRDECADQKQDEEDRAQAQERSKSSETEKLADGDSNSKREERARWWRDRLAEAFVNDGGSLFHHPSIAATIEAVEQYTESGEKVLVFGRFTRPLRALADLLNAREMLRSLMAGREWPQSKVHRTSEEDEWEAIEAARRQLNCTMSMSEIEHRLEMQYAALDRRRENLREHLFEWIAAGLSDQSGNLRTILDKAATSPNADCRSILARALDDLLEARSHPSPSQCAQAFYDLVSALRDRDDGDLNGNGVLAEPEAAELWSALEGRLREEYGTQRGSFARLMYGETKLPTRRMLQLAFNRVNSFPRVLIAQSMVGREGLNLHQACRVVVLIHPEWNPGVLEQQIGRVDRVGSRWSQMLDQAITARASRDDVPRIEIRPVIFKGTYDEHQWKVLRERWDDLRAQLHGLVVPQRLRSTADPAEQRIAQQLDEMGPDFSPLPAPV